MKFITPAFAHNGIIPANYTCDGENLHPPLVISDVPAEAKSLALIVDDPDAPQGDFTHWTVWNISPETREMREGSVPEGACEGMTDFGRAGWGGPCPHRGTHRYFFKLYALDTRIDLVSTATKADLVSVMERHILARAEFMGRYARSNKAD